MTNDFDQPALPDSFSLMPPTNGYVLPSEYLSVSQIEMYMRCPRQYEFRYLKDMRRLPGVSMAFGSAMHKGVEITHNHLIDHGKPAPHDAVESSFVDTLKFISTDISEDEWVQEGVTEARLTDVGTRLIRSYNTMVAPQVRPQVKDGVRGVEKRFKTDICSVPIVGVIDLIDTNTETGLLSTAEKELLEQQKAHVPEIMRTAVIDFKTKQKSFSQADVNNALQLTMYSYVEQVPTVRFDQFLRLKIPTFKRIQSTRAASDYQWLKQIVVGVAKAIHAGSFPPCDPAAWACSPKWCGYWSLCRGRKS